MDSYTKKNQEIYSKGSQCLSWVVGLFIYWSLSSLHPPQSIHMKLLWEWKVNFVPQKLMNKDPKIELGDDKGVQIQVSAAWCANNVCNEARPHCGEGEGWGRWSGNISRWADMILFPSTPKSVDQMHRKIYSNTPNINIFPRHFFLYGLLKLWVIVSSEK